MAEKELPTGWDAVLIKHISQIVRGVTYGKKDARDTIFDNGCLILRGGNIQDGKIVENEDTIYVPNSLVKENQKLKKGDVIVVSSTGSTKLIGKAAHSTKDEDFVSFGAFSTLLRPSPLINYKVFNYYFQTEYYRSEIRALAGGVNINNIKREHLENLMFPLPPLAEQNRIVEKLDKLFASLEIVQTKLDAIPQLIKNFRQAVLNQAVTGKLTALWRDGRDLDLAANLISDIFKFKEKWALEESLKGNSEAKRLLVKLNNKIKNVCNDSMPLTWGEYSLSDACHLVIDCHNKTAPYQDKGIFLIRTTNIKKGKIFLKDMRFVSDDTYALWSKRSLPQPGDILFTREAPMGEAAIIPEGMKVCLGQRTMLLRCPQHLLLNNYVLYCLLSPLIALQINSKAIGTGVKHLRVGDVENLRIPIPGLKEQEEIVSRVEVLFEKADLIENQYQLLKTQLDNLSQAILRKVFTGKLVAQSPSDEPAGALLLRIKELQDLSKKLTGLTQVVH